MLWKKSHWPQVRYEFQSEGWNQLYINITMSILQGFWTRFEFSQALACLLLSFFSPHVSLSPSRSPVTSLYGIGRPATAFQIPEPKVLYLCVQKLSTASLLFLIKDCLTRSLFVSIPARIRLHFHTCTPICAPLIIEYWSEEEKIDAGRDQSWIWEVHFWEDLEKFVQL